MQSEMCISVLFSWRNAFACMKAKLFVAISHLSDYAKDSSAKLIPVITNLTHLYYGLYS